MEKFKSFKYKKAVSEDIFDESCISGEFQRAAPGRKVSIITSKHAKKSLGKKDKYNTLGENMRFSRSRRLEESNEALLDLIMQDLDNFVQQNCPELKGCLDSYEISLRNGDFGTVSEIASNPEYYTSEFFYKDFISYVKVILSGVENYFYN